MGYNTEFEGAFELDRRLAPEHAHYLRLFSSTRRMKRDAALAVNLRDPVRLAAKLPIGMDGEYFTGGDGFMGQDDDASVVEYSKPPAKQPGLWCLWQPGDNDRTIVWNGGESFYYYVEWLEYLIQHFVEPWGYVLNGEVNWLGEEPPDKGVIQVANNLAKASVLADDRAPFDDDLD